LSRPPRIDSHQHFWKYDPGEYSWIDERMGILKRDFLPEHLRTELVGAGFDACIAVQARQSLEETRFLLELAERNPFVAGVVGWVDLRAGDVQLQLERFAGARKLVGIRHIVQAEPDDRFLLREDFCRGVEALQAFGLAYDILVYPRQLRAAIEFAARFPKMRFVLDHLAKPEIKKGETSGWARQLRELAAQPHVLCKLSGLVTEADWGSWTIEQIRPCLDVALECFGPGRLMIGSDWPVCTLAADYARTMGVVLDHLQGLPPAERDAVLGGNAQKFWRLEVGQGALEKP
jgi:L-fuconolactonase